MKAKAALRGQRLEGMKARSRGHWWNKDGCYRMYRTQHAVERHHAGPHCPDGGIVAFRNNLKRTVPYESATDIMKRVLANPSNGLSSFLKEHCDAGDPSGSDEDNGADDDGLPNPTMQPKGTSYHGVHQHPFAEAHS
mmetsp:Transcript_22267/g.57046  ORF Transcript_22267/g.57046 Transcript_22267/m.57046 type:complete len:137 (-) Transcript_22267:486-896(-)